MMMMMMMTYVSGCIRHPIEDRKHLHYGRIIIIHQSIIIIIIIIPPAHTVGVTIVSKQSVRRCFDL